MKWKSGKTEADCCARVESTMGVGDEARERELNTSAVGATYTGEQALG